MQVKTRAFPLCGLHLKLWGILKPTVLFCGVLTHLYTVKPEIFVSAKFRKFKAFLTDCRCFYVTFSPPGVREATVDHSLNISGTSFLITLHLDRL